MEQNLLKSFMFAVFGLAVISFTVQPVMADEISSEEWQLTGSIYLWAPDIKGETTTGADLEIDFDTIIENLDLVYMGSLEARKKKWSFIADVIYMDVEDDPDETFFHGPLDNLTLKLRDVELESWIVSAAAAYNIVNTDRFDLNLLAGARYLWMESTLKTERRFLDEITRSSATGSGHIWDGIVGVRGAIVLGEGWSLPFHFDVGTGDTDLTWQAIALVSYKVSKWDVALGYRHLEWDFDDSDTGGDVFNDLYISGPIVGVKYSF